MLEEMSHLRFSYGIFIVLGFPHSQCIPLSDQIRKMSFMVLTAADILCSLSLGVLVRKVKGSDAGQLYAMKVLARKGHLER